jgi:hypothetical protein
MSDAVENALRGLSQEVISLPFPLGRKRLQELGQPCRRPRVQNALDEVRGEERESQYAAHVASPDAFGVGEFGQRPVLTTSSIRRHRQARASALTSVPSGCRPPGRWDRIGIRTTSVLPSSLVSTARVMRPSSRPAATRRPSREPPALPTSSALSCTNLKITFGWGDLHSRSSAAFDNATRAATCLMHRA